MAQKNYKVNESIEVIYQAAGSESGAGVIMNIFTPDHVADSDFPDVVMTEIGNSGRYYGDFIPNAEGEWSVQIAKSDGTGKSTKAFSVGGWNVHTLGAKVIVLEGKATDSNVNLGVVHTKVDELKTGNAARDTKLDNMKADTDKLGDIEADVNEIKDNLPDMKSPPLIA